MEKRDRAVVNQIKIFADSIDPNLTVSTAVCSDYSDGRLPILDLKVWIGEGKDGSVKILHSHYMKVVSNRAVMHQLSSHSEKMKFNVFVNEILRILRNCSEHTVWKEEAARHVSYFMRRMQYSGFSEETRFRVLNAALREYDGKVSSGTVVNRRQGRKKKESKQDWYKAGGKYDSVMFVEATPESILKKAIEKVIRKFKVKIKVVERVGTTVKRVLQKSNPFQGRDCGREGCLICAEGSKNDCRVRGVVYELWCKECLRKYRGQTGRSAYVRIREHMDEGGADDKPVKRHRELFHGGREVEVGCKVLYECYGKPSRRMISESVMIDALREDETMNSRREWSYAKLNKVIL